MQNTIVKHICTILQWPGNQATMAHVPNCNTFTVEGYNIHSSMNNTLIKTEVNPQVLGTSLGI